MEQDWKDELDDLLKESGSRSRDTIPVLHKVQERFGHVPPEALPTIARRLHVSESELYGVLSFYKAFSLRPKDAHTISVCLGTACHVRGGEQIIQELENALGISAGKSTADGLFTLETVNCLGCCAIGPVMVVDGVTQARITPQAARELLARIRAGEKKS
ncbi:MAG: NAD(P)H-dependent oxidoreductase subunit E [Candidatus Aminicenantes bacterium]|nr:NAD(P)H-dependent oxidoreductase subunit E [Candidatus Aminicenantes bacterium]